MAIENTYLTGNAIQLGSSGFDLAAPAPLDTRATVPTFAGLAALKNGGAVYEGMRVYVETGDEQGNYQYINGEWKSETKEIIDLVNATATAAMEFKGATATLPENATKGDMYKVAGENINITIDGVAAKIGDSVVYDGEKWYLIPSGDDIEDTWRIIKINGASLGGIAEGKTLNLTAGDKLNVGIDENTGDVVYSHEEIAAPTVKKVGEDEGDEPTRTYIASIETDGYGHITGYKTATENVEDTDTTYEFEGLPKGEDETAPSNVSFQVKSSDADSAEVIYLDAYNKNEADGKFVAKEAGKSLISDTEIARLAEVDNYDDEEVRGLIGDNTDAIDELSEYVGTFTHSTAKTVVEYVDARTSGIATSDNLEQLDNRVKAVEGFVDTHKNDYTNDQIDQAIGDATGALGTMSTKDANDYLTKTEIEATYATDANAQKYAKDVEDKLADYTKTADLPTDLGDFTNNAGYAKTTEVANTYATKEELSAVDDKFEDYNTKEAQKVTDDAQNDRIKAIEDTYLVEADIADFETKDNVKKVADDLAAYVESNDKALAEAVEALEDADTALGNRITTLEGYFTGDNGTVADQIEAAVAAEAALREAADGELSSAIENIEKEIEGKLHTKDEIEAAAIEAVNDLIAGVDDETATLETLTSLVEYLNDHGDVVTGLTNGVETANTNASNAVKTADAASEVADGAATIANEAREIATNAVTGATTAAATATEQAGIATEKAGEAANSAAAADASAKAAADSAEEAGGYAADALASAENASSFADNAEASAQTANVAAGEAEAAQALAETAKGAAETAQGLAEEARDAAEGFATEAKNAQSAAEKAKADAEDILTQVTNVANGAQATADEAKELAEGAVATAGEAKTAAEGAVGTANAAKAKADTAVQAAGTGLKITTGTEDAPTVPTVEIDDTVVFIFNCGSATTNID